MRKFLSVALAATMALSLTACGGSDDKTTTQAVVETTKAPEETKAPEATEEDKTDAVTEADKTDAPETEATAGKMDLGQILADDFAKYVTEGTWNDKLADLTAEIAKNPSIPFMYETVVIEPGNYVPGFKEELKDYKGCGAIMPFAMGMAFCAYVFELPADADAAAFESYLLEQADPRWNICTIADNTLTKVQGNYVFFSMYPNYDENGEQIFDDDFGDDWGDDWGF